MKGQPIRTHEQRVAAFFEKVQKQDDGCWRWVGCLDATGYGRFSAGAVDGRRVSIAAHRFAYQAVIGPIAPNMDLDHLCRHRWCCNPAHLEPTTRKENLRRGARRGYGDFQRTAPLRRRTPGATPAERFWNRVDKSGDCWIWTGAKTGRTKHGSVWNGQRTVLAHRYAYELVVGVIPEGLVLDHLCRVPACVNPDHLEPVTLGENTRRALSRSHCHRGHEKIGDNLYVDPSGQRKCRACRQIGWNVWVQRPGTADRLRRQRVARREANA